MKTSRTVKCVCSDENPFELKMPPHSGLMLSLWSHVCRVTGLRLVGQPRL